MNGSIRAPKHLWAVGGVSALWNAFGAFNYVMTQTRNEAYLAQITDSQRAYMESFPAWAEAAWALGVWGALAGSLLLLARSRHAVAAFALSLAGLLGTTIYQFGMSALPAEMASGAAVALHLTIWAIAIGLLIYAYRMRARGVLR
jgi:hypothetical protein